MELKNDFSSNSGTVTISNGTLSSTIDLGPTTNISSSSTTFNIFDQYEYPKLIDTLVFQDRIELVYRQNPSSSISYTGYNSIGYHTQPPVKIYKDIYMAVDNELKKVERVEGTFLPARGDSYEF